MLNKALTSIVEGIKVIKKPTPEQYGGLAGMFLEIHNLLNLSFISQERVQDSCFVKFKDQERWYLIGDDCAAMLPKSPPLTKNIPHSSAKELAIMFYL